MEEIRRKALSIIGGVLLASLLTYFITFLTYLLKNPLLTYFFPFTLMGIASIGAFAGGFLSRDIKAGFLIGLLAGTLGVPIIAQYLRYILPAYVPEWAAPAEETEIPFTVFLIRSYSGGIGIYILFGLVAGAVGSMGAWTESKFHKA